MKKQEKITLWVLVGADAVETYENGRIRATQRGRINHAMKCAGGNGGDVHKVHFDTQEERKAFINGMYMIDPSGYSILD